MRLSAHGNGQLASDRRLNCGVTSELIPSVGPCRQLSRNHPAHEFHI